MSRRSLWIAIGLVFLAFALRVYRLDYLSLRGDESFTVLFVAQPLTEMVDGIRNVEPNPPLYYFVLRGALLLFGESDWAARYVSAWFGVLAVPLLYQLARALLRGKSRGRAVALVAAGLLAINPYQIWHSQDVRNYTLWPALSLASLYFLWRALKENRRLLWIAYGATALLSLYTHYYDAFLILFENVFVFAVSWRDRATLRRWIVVQAVLALLYLPWPFLFSSRPFSYVDATAYVPGLLGILKQGLSVFSLGETLPQPLGILLLPVLAILLVVGLGFALRRDRRVFMFVVLYLLVPSFCVYLLSLWRPLFRDRYLNGIAPAYYLAFALGLAALARLERRRILAGAAGLLVLAVPMGLSLGHYYFDPAYAKSADWRGLASFLEAVAGPDDAIIENYPDPTLTYYYDGPAEFLVLPHRSAVDQVGNLPVKRKATGNTLQRLLAERRTVWLIPYRSGWDPDGYVEGWLDHHARKIREEQVDVFRLVAYERAEMPAPDVPYAEVSQLGSGIQLLGYDVNASGACRLESTGDEGPELVAARSGSCSLHLVLYWHDVALVDSDYTVFAHLLDAEGRIVDQRDSQPQGGAFPTGLWFPGDTIVDGYDLSFPLDAMPGEYTVRVGLYLPETGLRLDATDAGGERWPDDAIRLGLSIRVTP